MGTEDCWRTPATTISSSGARRASRELRLIRTSGFQGANPWTVIAFSGDRHRTLGANSVYFVVLNGKQHSVHFSRKAADDTAWELSYEVYLQQPPVDGQEEISVLSFTEMMESPVEMVI